MVANLYLSNALVIFSFLSIAIGKLSAKFELIDSLKSLFSLVLFGSENGLLVASFDEDSPGVIFINFCCRSK